MKQTIILIFLFTSNLLTAQLLKARISDRDSLKGIGFASIGILHQNFGTVADEQGRFSIDLSRFSDTDTLRISAIGYEEIRFLIQHCRSYLITQESLNLELTPAFQSMDEVQVSAGKSKTLISGNNIKSPMFVAGFQNRALGAELGTVLKYNKKKKGRLMRFNFNVSGQQSDSILFRINLYSMKNGFPDKNLLKTPIYAKNAIVNSVISIDLSDENIYIHEDCFLALELIQHVDFEEIFFKSAFLRSPSFHRSSSEGAWEKTAVDLGIWAEIWYKK